MTSNPLTKDARQQESMWTVLHKQISGMSYDYSTLFDTASDTLCQEYVALDTLPHHCLQLQILFLSKTEQ